MDHVDSFDRLAAVYDRLAPPTPATPLVGGVARATRPVERVLDLGGGTGRGASALCRWLDVETVVVDAAPGMLARARRAGHAAVAGDAARLPLADEAVDAAVVVDALHHLPTHPRVLGEVARVLRPGGVVVLREFDPDTVAGRLLAVGETLVGFDSTFHAPAALAAHLWAAGFEATVTGSSGHLAPGYTVAGVWPAERVDTSASGTE